MLTCSVRTVTTPSRNMFIIAFFSGKNKRLISIPKKIKIFYKMLLIFTLSYYVKIKDIHNFYTKQIRSRKKKRRCFYHFKRIYDMFQQIKLDYSCTLLVSTNYNIPNIAEAIGIKDISYFNKLFKKHYGIFPTAYRKKIQFPHVKCYPFFIFNAYLPLSF